MKDTVLMVVVVGGFPLKGRNVAEKEYQVKGSKLEGLVETLSETLDQMIEMKRINNEKKIPYQDY